MKTVKCFAYDLGREVQCVKIIRRHIWGQDRRDWLTWEVARKHPATGRGQARPDKVPFHFYSVT